MSKDCKDCEPDYKKTVCAKPIDSRCVIYDGNNVECLNIIKGENINSVVKKITDATCALSQLSGTTLDILPTLGNTTHTVSSDGVFKALQTKVDKVVGKGLSTNDYTLADKNKLTGIAANATANNTDLFLLNRANHTGVQGAETIANLTEVIQDAVANFLVAGTNTNISYNDQFNTLTIASTTSGSTLDNEAVRDIIGLTLVAGNNISLNVDDTANTITIASAATVNSTDAALRDRNTHTGTQAISTIVNLQSSLDGKASSIHTHTISEIANLQINLDAKSPLSHSHPISAITGLQSALDGKQVAGSYASLSHTHSIANITDIVLTNPSSGQVLKFNGTNWINDIDNIGGGGGGSDMFKATYDTNNNGVVDDAEKLNNQVGTYYLTRSNHTGTQSADSIVNGSTNRVFTISEQTKLSGIAAGATVNSSDSFLLNRTNHTGTQLAATISDLQVSITNNTNVSLNTAARHSHSNKTVLDAITASYTTSEQTKLAGIATGATANSSDSTLLNRLNHTGSQEISTITNLQTTLNNKAALVHTHLLSDISNVVVTNPSAGQVLKYNGTNWVNDVDTVGTSGGSGNMSTATYDSNNNGIVDNTEKLNNQLPSFYLARANHTGTQSADSLTDGTNNKVYTTSEKTKLTSIAPGATVNSSDAFLVNRSNHTGTQSAATIIQDANNRFVTDTQIATWDSGVDLFFDNTLSGSGSAEDPLRTTVDAAEIQLLVGVLTNLTTVQKDNLVAAINEVNAKISGNTAGSIVHSATPPASGNFYLRTTDNKLGAKNADGTAWLYFTASSTEALEIVNTYGPELITSPYTTTIDQPYWDIDNLFPRQNQLIDADGVSQTVAKLYPEGTNSEHRARLISKFTWGANKTYVFEASLKASGKNFAMVFIEGVFPTGTLNRVVIDLTNGTTTSQIGTVQVTSEANGYYRVKCTFTVTQEVTDNKVEIRVLNSIDPEEVYGSANTYDVGGDGIGIARVSLKEQL